MRFIALIPLLKAAGAVQMVHLGWEAANVPASGLQDVTFPMAMPKAPHESGYYFEQAVSFQNVPSGYPNTVIYTGLQPRPDQNGQSIVHATYSSFFPNSTTTDANCHPGADNGPGVSCAIDVQASYDDTYHLQINVTKQTYNGTLVNQRTKQAWHMGSFDLPDGVSGMQGGYWVGFVEYYYTGLGDCSKYPYTAATFGTPLTSAAGVEMSLTAPWKDGSCGSDMPWSVTSTVPGTYEITVGEQQSK
ncbi:hypothetical protein J3458_021451 [Metarhizium acridum]|uniref:Uncharacterized protein n=1 Tax=Metarhizium acridum (strain CQMa 102) TaxID=655827 RepID=E9EIJ0_METAQ|nr:uncharacterized protein MAC_09688 [Metarhizium acridum CQMa 102]EFY84280.1 hypothetical protein MAC_09688 [Metarhizium acridum CQMa 102]KAG8406124.1 hypothetical protein J3458_021451 [Metarhizium acridum]